MDEKVVVLGSGGLLGSHICALYPEVTGISKAECDITKRGDIFQLLLKHRPNIIINCVGITPKVDTNYFEVNSFGPKLLETLAGAFGCRVIHISTNCVYSGRQSYRTENCFPDPIDEYGLSKFLGEIVTSPHLTIRTSFVGLPDPNGRGLLAWAEKQTEISGYKNYMWNGITTVELARVIMEILVPSNMTGLLHVYGETINKYDLLKSAKKIFKWDVNITPVEEPRVWRTLGTIYVPLVSKPFEQQLDDMNKVSDKLWGYY